MTPSDHSAFRAHPDFQVGDPEPYVRLDAQLCFALWAGSRLMVRAYEPILSALGLTYPQYLVMMVLWETDGQPVRALASRVRMQPEELDDHLTTMVAKALLDLEGGEADTDVWLTPDGHALRERALLVPNAIRCRLEMPEDDIGRMKEQLEAMMANIERTAPSGDESSS